MDRLPQTPNGFPPQHQSRPALQKFRVHLRAPGTEGLKVVAELQHVSATAAALVFISQLGGDASGIDELRITKESAGIITPG